MKGYYKNWYQHYLEVERQKEKDLQKGYFSNLLVSEEEVAPELKRVVKTKLNQVEPNTEKVNQGPKKKFKSTFLSVFLPLSTVGGFVFLWYQLGVAPVQQVVHDILVHVGVREAAVDVLAYHDELLERHAEMTDKIGLYVSESGLEMTDLRQMYDEIKEAHLRIDAVSDETFAEAIRLWRFKLVSLSEMMSLLDEGEDHEESYMRFVLDQEEIATLIISEIGEER